MTPVLDEPQTVVDIYILRKKKSEHLRSPTLPLRLHLTKPQYIIPSKIKNKDICEYV